MRVFITLLAFCFISGGAFAQVAPIINEFVFNHTGTDDHEFIEMFGEPNADLSVYSIIGLEGDGIGAGVVDNVFNIGTTDGGGFWTTGFLTANTLENGTLSLLLVVGFTGSLGQDLDADNDGMLDAFPWSSIADAVAVWDGGASDWTYADAVLDPSFDGLGLTVGGASRIPNGFDTDAASDWMRNDFDGFGLPGFVGTPVLGEAINTPGTCNTPFVPEPGTLVLVVLGPSALLLRRRTK
jgi:hypothetical protein